VYSAGIWGIAGGRLKERLTGRPVRCTFLAAYFTTYEHEYWGHVQGASRKDYGLATHLLMRLLYHAAGCFYGPIERRLLAASDKVVVHYDSTRQILLNTLPGISEKTVKIPYAIDLSIKKKDGPLPVQNHAERRVPAVTVLCRQDPRKGIGTFLKAVKILVAEGVEGSYLVAGDGIFLQRNKRLAQRLGLSGIVTFAGFVDSVEDVLEGPMCTFFRHWKRAPAPSRFSRRCSGGKPSSRQHATAFPKDLVNEQTALLVPPGDDKQLAAAIGRFMTDEALRRTIGRNAREEYARRFTRDAMNQGIRALIGGLKGIA